MTPCSPLQRIVFRYFHPSVRVLVSCALAFLVGTAPPLLSADWPQFRHDAGRTAASTEELPTDLHLKWIHHFAAPRPAFPDETRLQYDLSYEPVVRNQTMYVPSMVTDTVTALDTETGKERWRFFAEGPVRFAPVAGPDKVYFVSDDGYLYALNAADGSLCWKFRGVPSGQSERKLLGHQRLISLWPARGAPVLYEDRVYFAAGLWPAYGTAVHALEKDTGEVVWSNTDSNRIPAANMDHGIGQYAGLTPQGYLAVVADKLVVPCGAQLPAFLDLETGELDKYCMGWGGRVGLPKGSWFVAGAGNILSHSGDLYDATRRNQETFRESNGRGDFKSQLYAGALLRLQIDPSNQRALGPFQEPVLTPETIYMNEPEGGAGAYDLASGKLEDFSAGGVPPQRKDDRYPDHLKMRFAKKWDLPVASRIHIKAGPSLVVGRPGVVEVIGIPQEGDEPRITWRAGIPGLPHRMLAADSKLFVVTREGSIFAFAASREDSKTEPVEHRMPRPETRPADSWTRQVAMVLEKTQVADGYVVVMGVESGRLLEELIGQTNAFVIAVDRDAGRVDRIRRRLHRSGLYGTRASVHVGDPLSFPLPPFIANLVLSESWERVTSPSPPGLVEAVSWLLRPYGGSACWAKDGLDLRTIHEGIQRIDDSHGGHLTARQDGELLILEREGALPGTADWSHPEANPANTGANTDGFVKAPLDLLWFDGASRWHRKPGMALVRVAGGRVLVKSADLQALDVYTGRVLWACALPAPHTPSDQLVVGPGGIFVTSGRTCLVVHPRTGREVRRLELPAEFQGPLLNLRVTGDRLVAQSGEHLFCMDSRSGEIHWKLAGSSSKLSVALGGGKVFCAELVDGQRKQDQRRGVKEAGGVNQGQGEAPPERKTRALDLGSGDILWEIPGGSRLAYSKEHDLLVTANGIYSARDGSIVAETSSFARTLGDKACELLSIIGDRVLWGTPTSYMTYDLSTGKAVDPLMAWVRRGCTSLRASTHLVTTRFKANCAYIDVASRQITSLWNIRPGCNNNLFPANGILNIPNLTGGCECNYTPTSQAYVPRSVLERVRTLRRSLQP